MDLTLRALEPEDVDILYDWENRRSLWQLSNTLAPFSRFVLTKYIETSHLDIYQTRQLRLMIDVYAGSNARSKTIGTIDLFDYEPLHQRAGVGVLIGDDSEKRKGYAGRALEILKEYCVNVLQLHQLYCNIEVSNEASMQLFKKHGFVKIGVKKDWNKTNEGYIDEAMLQLIL